jgi:hypothetical protein
MRATRCASGCCVVVNPCTTRGADGAKLDLLGTMSESGRERIRQSKKAAANVGRSLTFNTRRNFVFMFCIRAQVCSRILEMLFRRPKGLE